MWRQLRRRGRSSWCCPRATAPAAAGFFRSVALGQAAGDRTGNLQDILRLLTLWFAHGGSPAAMEALQEGFGLVSIDTWLVVIPQVGPAVCMMPAVAQPEGLARCSKCCLTAGTCGGVAAVWSHPPPPPRTPRVV